VTDDRARQLMQSALDGDTEADAQLQAMLQQDPEQAAEFATQQQVDDLLRYPPMERAPERLGLSIMARVAKAMQKRRHAQPLNEAQLRVALQLVIVTSQPLLAGAGYLLMNSQSNPQAVERLLVPALALLIAVTDMMDVMLERAQAVYDEDPELAIAMIMMMPSALLLLVEEVLNADDLSES
jgi:anti-sigma factor RsiW